MNAATDMFLSLGYEEASMEAIAIRAGVPKSTLYKRFPDKKALLQAVLTERVSTWSLAEEKRDLGGDFPTRLKRIAKDLLQRAGTAEVRSFCALASKAWSDPDEAGSRLEIIGYTKMVDRFAREIRLYGPRHGIEAKYPRQVATALMAMLAGWIEFVGPVAEQPENDANRFADAAVDLLLRGSVAW
jgi:AcrR family transcriptional regulator